MLKCFFVIYPILNVPMPERCGVDFNKEWFTEFFVDQMLPSHWLAVGSRSVQCSVDCVLCRIVDMLCMYVSVMRGGCVWCGRGMGCFYVPKIWYLSVKIKSITHPPPIWLQHTRYYCSKCRGTHHQYHKKATWQACCHHPRPSQHAASPPRRHRR